MHLWKSYIRSNQLDVQETNFSFAQLNRIRNYFLEGLRTDCIPSLDLWDLIVTVLHGNTNQRTSTGKLVYISNAKENSWKD